MSTGGGKTLVGLLIAQAIVNETGKKVLYICPTNQLVEQVRASAKEAGLQTAQYTSAGWADEDVFRHGKGCCVTNYAAVFNSRSRFRSEQLGGVIFDDAHVAHNAIRGQFTVSIKRDSSAFQPLLEEFVPYLKSVRKDSLLENIQTGRPNQLVYIPLFISSEKEAALRTHIKKAIEHENNLGFPFGFIEDHLRACTVMISGDRIEIAPPVLPIRTLQYFDQARRVYLTATMPSGVEFIRLFGASNAKTIDPEGKLGAAQRLILSSVGKDPEEHRAFVQKLLKKRKACVIVPSTSAGEKWGRDYPVFDSKSGHTKIRAFADSKGAAKLVLVARFDGVDLPGDACRILVLENIPMGAFLFEKFLDQGLRINRVRAANVSGRIIQAMGRIFRSNTDHGVVILCGKDIQEWVEDTENRVYFPPLLQQQIEFGIALDAQVHGGKVSHDDLIDAVIGGDADWDEQYNNFVPLVETRSLDEEAKWSETVALFERTGFENLWNSNFDGAVSDFNSALELVPTEEQSQRAWLMHLKGYALFLGDEPDEARAALAHAANLRAELGRLPEDDELELLEQDELLPDPTQLEKFLTRAPYNEADYEKAKSILSKLEYGSATDACEEALQAVGFYLGLETSRADKQGAGGTGPDVVWSDYSSGLALGLECKTNKKPEGVYRKEDIGQVADHSEFMKAKFKGHRLQVCIVGKYLEVVDQCNPPSGLRVIELSQFKDVADRILSAFRELVGKERPKTFVAAKLFRRHRFAWPACFESMESRLAADLRPSSHPELPR